MSARQPLPSLDHLMDRETIASFYSGPRVFDSNDNSNMRLTVRAANDEGIRVRLSGGKLQTIPHARWAAFIASWTQREATRPELRHQTIDVEPV